MATWNLANINCEAVETTSSYISDAGESMFAKANVTQPSDIDYVVVEGHKVTWKDEPEIITRLYHALHSMYGINDKRQEHGEKLMVIQLRSGQTIRFEYEERKADKTWTYDEVFVPGIFHSKDLPSVLKEVRRHPASAARDASTGEYDVATIDAVLPGNRRVNIMPSSAQGRLLLMKAKALVDCMDLRLACAVGCTSEYLESLANKNGAVFLKLSRPTQFTVHMWDWPPVQSSDYNWYYWTDFSYQSVASDELGMVIGFNGKTNVCFYDLHTNQWYTSKSYLTRRLFELDGVCKYDLPGHPANDVEYYKKPEKVYREMMEIVRQTYARSKKAE